MATATRSSARAGARLLERRPIGTATCGGLGVWLRRSSDGPVLAHEPARPADLDDARAELWLEAALRRGRPEIGPDELALHLRPALSGERCIGFVLETDVPALKQCVFTALCLEPVAQRAVRRLREAGVLEKDEVPLYGLALDADDGSRAPRQDDGGIRVVATAARRAPAVLSLPLAPLFARAEPRCAVGEERDYPVLYTQRARAKAERCSRRGAAAHPPVETGGMLAGHLCSCPETGELFALVVDVIEARHAECTTYSLTYSGETWARIERVLAASRRRPGQHALRLLGQCHGHSFLPAGGAPPCAECATTKVCTRTSAVLSDEDLAWSRAVFPGEPWQLGHVFGLNARGEPVEGFFGQRGGRLAARGYHVLANDVPLP